MNISKVSFGQVILSENLKKVMIDNQENPEEIEYFKQAQPNCTMDLCKTANNCYLQARTTGSKHIKEGISENYFITPRSVPCIADLIMCFERLKFKVHDMRNQRKSCKS